MTITKIKHNDKTFRQENSALAEIDYLLFERFVRDEFNVYATNMKDSFLELFVLSNGSFYLSLKQVEPIKLVNEMSYFDGEMSADAASICICILALSEIIRKMPDSEQKLTLRHKYTGLWNYVDEHDEVQKMRHFLD